MICTNFRLIVAAGLILLLAPDSGNGDATSTEPAKIDVKFEVSRSKDDRLILKGTLTNISSAPFSVYRHSLPWGNRYSIILVVVEAKFPHKEIQQSFPFDDLGTTKAFDVMPMEKLSGDIRIADFCPTIEKELGNGDLYILWRYQLRTVDGRSSPVLTGTIDLVRKD